MNDTLAHSISVAGITFNAAGQVLVIKRRDNGQWQAPGGILEVNETFEAGVAREIFEETGVSVEVGELTGVYKNMTRRVVALVFRCRPQPDSEIARASDESLEALWVPVSEAMARMTPAFAVRVEDALAPGGHTIVRVHNGVEIL